MTYLRRISSGSAIILGAGGIIAAALMLGPDRQGHAGQQPQKQQRLPHPVVDTHDLMELFNKPVLEFLKETMQNEPTTDQQWKTVRERGLQVAEVANLVAIRESADKVPQWIERSAAVQQAGLALAEAGRSKNWRAAQSSYRNLIQSCNDCHQNVAPQRAPMLEP